MPHAVYNPARPVDRAAVQNIRLAHDGLDDLRRDYAVVMAWLTYDSCHPVTRMAVEGNLPNPVPTDARGRAEAYLRAAMEATVFCGRCAGTGRFVTRVENGRPIGPGGACFRCGGKGAQTWEDGKRNHYFDRKRTC